QSEALSCRVLINAVSHHLASVVNPVSCCRCRTRHVELGESATAKQKTVVVGHFDVASGNLASIVDAPGEAKFRAGHVERRVDITLLALCLSHPAHEQTQSHDAARKRFHG